MKKKSSLARKALKHQSQARLPCNLAMREIFQTGSVMRQLINFMPDFMLVFHLKFPHFIFEAQVGYDRSPIFQQSQLFFLSTQFCYQHDTYLYQWACWHKITWLVQNVLCVKEVQRILLMDETSLKESYVH